MEEDCGHRGQHAIHRSGVKGAHEDVIRDGFAEITKSWS